MTNLLLHIISGVLVFFYVIGVKIKEGLSSLVNLVKTKHRSIIVIQAFIHSLNSGDDFWADYLTDDAIITIDPNAPYYVEKIADFVAYAHQAGCQFNITMFDRNELTVTCIIAETNKWLVNIPNNAKLWEDYERNWYRVIFKMKTPRLIESINMSDVQEYKRDFLFSFEDWLTTNDFDRAKSLFTNTSKLIYNGPNGAEIIRLSKAFIEMMTPLLALQVDAEEAVWMKEYKTAVAYFTDMLNLKPGSIIQYATLISRAAVYDKMGEYDAAIDDYKMTITMKENEPDAGILNKLCWDYIITKQPKLALPYCNQSIPLDSTRTALDTRGIVYGMLGNYEAAIADLMVDADLNHTPEEKTLITHDQRDTWISQMQDMQNPFTYAVITELYGKWNLL